MKFKTSIRWALIFGFLGLIWGTHVITTTSSYLTSQEVLHRHARDIMMNIADLALEQSQRHLLHAHGATALTKRLLASKVVSNQSDGIGVLERYLSEQLSVNPHFAGIYVGMPNGDFYDVRHYDAKIKDGFRTKLILNAPQGRTVRLVYRDSRFQPMLEETDDADPYDPRQRPWYQKAIAQNRIVWTNPYIFYTSRKPGITIAGPFFDASGKLMGVVGVDIEIDQLSVFIGNLKIGKNGKAFMLNRNGDVVAFGDLSKLIINKTLPTEASHLATIWEIDDSLSRKAFQAARIEKDPSGMLVLDGPRFARFEHQGQRHLAMFIPFTASRWPWITGVYLPEDDYLGAIKSNQRFNILITLIISLFAAFIGFLLARGVIRPIAQLGKTSREMKMGMLAPGPKIQSGYKEIQDTADAFAEMKNSVENSHKKYLDIFNNIQDVYYEASLNGTLIEISPSIEKISHYRRHELIGKKLLKIYSNPSDRDDIVKLLIVKGTINDHEVVFKDEDGSLKHCALNSTLLKTASGKPYRIIGSLRNINDRMLAEKELRNYKDHLENLVQERTTELQEANDGLRKQIERRREIEARLRTSEERYRTILDTIDEAYFETDPSGTIIYVNDAASRIMGYSSLELAGMHFRHFSDHQSIRDLIRDFGRMVRSGAPARVITFPVITKDGQNKILDVSATLIRDGSGPVTGFRGLARDVTATILARKEKEKLQRQLHHAQRMEAVGTLAGGIAHDFNNLMMGIIGNTSLLDAKLGDIEPFSKYIRSIEQCVESGAALTRQLLGYARGGKYRVTTIDLNETLQRTTEMFGRTRKEITIRSSYQENIWPVEADQGQIDQVLVNLYVNAWQAMTDDNTLILSTANVILDEAYTRAFNARSGAYVAVTVRDRGKGIAQDVMKRIFEPFFTTKKMGRGTGLGLASAFGIVKNHGGIIDVKSTVDRGSTFTIFLPAASLIQGKKPTAADEMPSAAGGSLLVVDDEPYLLKSLCAVLEDLGYETIPANSGHEAIKRFMKEMNRIDVVILDMIMPDLNGRQVLTELKKIKPSVKVILTSGYSLEGMPENEHDLPGDGFLQKPYRIQQLSSVIGKLVKQSRDG